MSAHPCFCRAWKAMAVCLCLLCLPFQSVRATEAEEEKLGAQVRADLKRQDFDAAIRRSEAVARRGSPALALGTGMLYILQAYDLRKHQATRPQIRQAEDRALRWIRLAARRGDESARDLARDVRRRGRRALYVPSLAHLMPE